MAPMVSLQLAGSQWLQSSHSPGLASMPSSFAPFASTASDWARSSDTTSSILQLLRVTAMCALADVGQREDEHGRFVRAVLDQLHVALLELLPRLLVLVQEVQAPLLVVGALLDLETVDEDRVGHHHGSLSS